MLGEKDIVNGNMFVYNCVKNNVCVRKCQKKIHEEADMICSLCILNTSELFYFQNKRMDNNLSKKPQ